jgi:hypothetical protein
MSEYDKLSTEADFDAFVARRKKQKTIAEIEINALEQQKASGKLSPKDQASLDRHKLERDEADLDISEEAPRRQKLQDKIKAAADADKAAKDQVESDKKTKDYREAYEEEYGRRSGAAQRQGPSGGAVNLEASKDPYAREVLSYLPKELGGTGEKSKTGRLQRTFEAINPLGLAAIFGRNENEIRAELQAEDIAKRGGGRIRAQGPGGYSPLEVIAAVQSGDPKRIATIAEALGSSPQDFAVQANAQTPVPARDLARSDVDIPVSQERISQGEVSAELGKNYDLGSKRLGMRFMSPFLQTILGVGTGAYSHYQNKTKEREAEAPRGFLPEDRKFFRDNVEPIRTAALKEANKDKLKEKEKANQLLADSFKTITGATYDSYGSLSPSFIHDQFSKGKKGMWSEGFSIQEDVEDLALAAYQKRARGEDPTEELSALRAAFNRAGVKNKGPTYIGGVPNKVGDMAASGIGQAGIFSMVPGKDGNPTLVVIPRSNNGYGSPIDVGVAPDAPEKNISSLGEDWSESDYLALPGAADALTKAISKRDTERRARGEPAGGTYKPSSAR